MSFSVETTKLPMSTLDAAQEARISAMHRGFLYQHLYAVGCLFKAVAVGLTSVVIERDEDIELVLPSNRIYLQVKTRSRPIIPSDIGSALERFSRLRVEHNEGRRDGTAQFVIVANQSPSPDLTEQIASGLLEDDTLFLFPGHPIPESLGALPPAWRGIDEAVNWCTSEAALIPHSMIAPESLVWKLAGLVLSAATGEMPCGGYVFSVESLPSLFEQLLIQLQDFPAPPHSYKTQIDEPDINTEAHVRIISGFSGAGKTSWASQAAAHSSKNCIYFNANETPGAALASSLVREIAANLVGSEPHVMRRILLPGTTGIESLHALDVYLSKNDRSPVVVIDNAHQISADQLKKVLEATIKMRFLLLCQPTDSIRELEALLNINHETLKGWDLDTLASEVNAFGAKAGAEVMDRLKRLTAGMPLYVQSAARIAVQDYSGNLKQFCDALDGQTNTEETSQEIILLRSFNGLSSDTRDFIAVLSLVDVVLKLEEVNALISAALELSEVEVATIIRTLRHLSIIEVFGDQRLKIHDALRLLGDRHLKSMNPNITVLALNELKNILNSSLVEERNPSRFSLYIRTLVSLEEIEIIIELAGDEMFHEMGIEDIFLNVLESAAASTDVNPDQRFWALDGLAFAKLKSGDFTSLEKYLVKMEELLSRHTLSDSAKLALEMKHMLLKAKKGDLPGVQSIISNIRNELPESQQYQLVFKYNAANSLWRLGESEQAEYLIEEVIAGYLNVLEISEEWIFGKSLEQLHPLLDKAEGSIDDVKHLADAMELSSILLKGQGGKPAFRSLFALKFYSLVGAVDSAVRVGQDVADDFVARNDFIGGRQILEEHVLPFAEHYQMLGRIVSIRSQYAVVLAYCGEFSAAEQEIEILENYAGGFSPEQRQEIENQRALIAYLREGNGPKQLDISEPRFAQPVIKPTRRPHLKIGRNEPCYCGSGLKYKKCHGKS